MSGPVKSRTLEHLYSDALGKRDQCAHERLNALHRLESTRADQVRNAAVVLALESADPCEYQRVSLVVWRALLLAGGHNIVDTERQVSELLNRENAAVDAVNAIVDLLRIEDGTP